MQLTDVIRGLDIEPVDGAVLASFRYLFKLASFHQLRRETATTPQQHKDLHSALMSSFDVLVVTKYAMLAALRGAKDETLQRRFADYDCLAVAAVRKLPKAQKTALMRSLAHVEVKSPREVRAACAVALKAVGGQIRLAARRLSFVWRANRYQPIDMVRELEEKAIRVFYFNEPFLTEAHVLNSMRQAVSNFALNRLAYYQAQRRRRLADRRDDDDNSPTVVTMYRRNEDGTTSCDVTAEVERAAVDPAADELELRCMLGDLRKRYRIRSQPLKARAFDILTGRQDKAFVAYVRKRHNLLHAQNVEDVRSTLSQRSFLAAVRQFLDVSERSFSAFIADIRSELNLYTEADP